MFWFKANNAYKKESGGWSSDRYEKTYSYTLSKTKFNSSLVHAICETTGYWFLKNDEEYGTEKYKKREEELNNMKLYIVEVGNYILDVSKETYDKILSEMESENSISIS